MKATPFLTIDELPENGRVIIYGRGQAAMTVLEAIRSQRPDVTIPCLLDSFSDGEAGGLRVIRKTELPTLAGTYDLILIASAWWREIGADLARDGVTEVAAASPVLWHKYIYSEADMAHAKEKLDAVEAMLATDEDKSVYRFMVQTRAENSPLVNTDGITPEIANFSQVKNTVFKHLTTQYLDFVVREPVKTMLHAGVFDGSDCLRFLDAFPNLEMVHGFEPQGTACIKPETLDRITTSGRVQVHPYGLWSSSHTIPLMGSGPFTTLDPSLSMERATGSIETISIDEFIASHNVESVDYICLDVEGAEEHALNGARKTIETHRPQLAVCIYHRKEDIHALPLFLDAMLKGYVYHVGHYHNQLNETVLYALPEELVR